MRPKKVGENSWVITLNKFIYPKHYIMTAYMKFSNGIDVKITKEDENNIELTFQNSEEKDVLEFINAVLAEIKEAI